MNKTTCSLVSGSVGALVVLTFVAGQPALAAQAHRGTAAKSAAIANGSVTTAKLADGAVTTPKIGTGAVTRPNLAPNSVGSDQVADGRLYLNDLASATGITALDFSSLPMNTCQASVGIETGHFTRDDLTLVSQPVGVAGNITLSARPDPGSATAIDIVACNNGNSTFDPPFTNYRWAVISS